MNDFTRLNSARHPSVQRSTDFNLRSLAFRAATAVVVLLIAGCAVPAAAPREELQPCPAADVGSPATRVVGATGTSHEFRPSLPASVSADLAAAGRGDHGCVILVAPDGTTQALSLTPRRADGQLEEGTARELLRQRTLAAIERLIGNLVSVSPGLDTRALFMAAFRAHPAPTTLILISSGVSTQLPVDLRTVDWSTDGRLLGAYLTQIRWLPRLAGWRVGLVGLGQVAGAQTRLPDPDVALLATFWLGVCRATGASCTSLGWIPNPQPPLSRNRVPVVRPEPVGEFTPPIQLSAEALFRRDSAALSAAADATLRSVVELVTRRDLVLSITGHTDASTGTARHNLVLSQQRARAVRDRLVRLGLAPDRIVSVNGAGSQGFSVEQETRQPALIATHRAVEIQSVRRLALP